jgi:hypothetical protein
MTFWCGSGSGSGYADPDPAISVIDPQDANKKTNKIKKFFCLIPYFLKVHLYHFSKIKSQKEVTNLWYQGFSYYFSLMTEGSGSGSILLPYGSGSDPGGPKTYGSGSATLV